jgi:hypothetical protein
LSAFLHLGMRMTAAGPGGVKSRSPLAGCVHGRQGPAAEADQWGRREEVAGGRGGPTLELNFYDLFLAGGSVDGCNTYLSEGRVGVELREGEERRVGGGLEHQHSQLCGTWYLCASLIPRRWRGCEVEHRLGGVFYRPCRGGGRDDAEAKRRG